MDNKTTNAPKFVYKNILDAIGNTPLIRLKKITQAVKSEIFAKLEYFNPMGTDTSGIFIGTMGLDANNYFAYSLDGINWEWANFADYPNGSFDPYKIGTALDVHCAAPAQAALIGDEHGIVNSS